MKIKFITANTAIGIPNMNNPIKNIYSLIKFHGLKIILFLLFKEKLTSKFDFSTPYKKNRVNYFIKNSTLENTLKMLKKENPDIFTLQELIYEVHKKKMTKWLEDNNYKYYCWGLSKTHPDMLCSTLIASKIPCEKINLSSFPQIAQMGGGAGIAGLKFKKYNINILGMHLAHGVPKTTEDEINFLIDFYIKENQKGFKSIFSGDFNADQTYFQKLSNICMLYSQNTGGTCPSFLHKKITKQLDHIFVPKEMLKTEIRTISFNSDHLGLKKELILKESIK